MTEQEKIDASEPPLDCWVGRDIVDRLRETNRRLVAAGYETYIGDAADEIERLREIETAARNLVAQKGWHHTQQAYERLAALLVPND